MDTVLFFDTETTGLPEWKIPSDDPSQPHIVQLAGVLVDVPTSNTISTLDVMVRPEGWVIPKEVTDIHGITTEMASDTGVSERLAIEMLFDMALDRKRVAFNTTFDNRIIRIGTKRYMSSDDQDRWKKGAYECAMIAASKIMGGKYPKLDAAYKHFTGQDLKDAHTAMADTLAAIDIWYACCAEAHEPMSENVPL